MKRIFLLVCFLSFGIAQAEEKPKTEDRFGVSAGIIGVWGFYEKAITKNFTLHSQIGYHGGFMMGTDSKLDYVFTTSIRIHPTNRILPRCKSLFSFALNPQVPNLLF